MPKPLLQDMVRVKTQSKPIKKKFPQKINPEEVNSLSKKNKFSNSKYRLYFVALISVVFLLFALSFLFSGAKIILTPKITDIAIKQNFTAAKNGAGVSFDLVAISDEGQKTIVGSEIKDVSIFSKGIAVIYNSFGPNPMTFQEGTRLLGSNGKIYKIAKKIIVPGMKKDKPGSIEVDIYASEAGKEYDSGLIDFQIPGLKNTPKYSKFYGRSKGEITGGFEGKMPIVSALDKEAATLELEKELEQKLLKKISGEIPPGFVLYEDASYFKIDKNEFTFVTDGEENVVNLLVRGTLYAFIFDEKKLAKKIAEDTVDNYKGEEIYIPNIKGLSFTLVDRENISFNDAKNINFNLSGNPKIIWKINEKKFLTDILKKKKSELNQILSGYPSIENAEVSLRPFWKNSFPEESKNVEIIVRYPEVK